MCSKSSSAQLSTQYLPDLSGLNDDERKIIEAVLYRQKLDEESSVVKQSVQPSAKANLTRAFASLNSLGDPQKLISKIKKHSINDIAQEVKQRFGDLNIDTGQVCELCHKTKFTTESSGRACVYCKLRCCVRCIVNCKITTRDLWICSQCKSKQNELFKSDKWLTTNGSNTLDKSNIRKSDVVKNENKSRTIYHKVEPSKALTSPTNLNMQNDKLQSNQITHRRQLPQINKANIASDSKQIDTPSTQIRLPDTFNGARSPNATQIALDHSVPKSNSLTSSGEDEEDYFVDEDFDEIHSTTEYTTGDDMDMESCSLSEKFVNMKNIDEYLGHNHNLGKEEILAAKMKKFLPPITWKLSPDNKGLIGNLVIKRNSQQSDAPFSIGFKVVGGRPKSDGTCGAFIERIKKGSLCETLYNLKCGDEILEWNSTGLRNLTYDQVANIMSNSRSDSQVDLVIERRVNMHNEVPVKSPMGVNDSSNNSKNKFLFEDKLSKAIPNPNIACSTVTKSNQFGRLQLKLYYDLKATKLFVTLVSIRCVGHSSSSIFCESYLHRNDFKDNSLRKTSEIVNLDSTDKVYNFSGHVFTYENVYAPDLNANLEIIMFDASKQGRVLAQCSITLRDANLKNDVQTQLLIQNSSTEDFGSNETLSTQSYTINSSSVMANDNLLSSKRRQLPQIPPAVGKSMDQRQMSPMPAFGNMQNSKTRVELVNPENLSNKQYYSLHRPQNSHSPQANENRFVPIKPPLSIPSTRNLEKPGRSPNTTRPDDERAIESPPLLLTKTVKSFNKSVDSLNSQSLYDTVPTKSRSRSNMPQSASPKPSSHRESSQPERLLNMRAIQIIHTQPTNTTKPHKFNQQEQRNQKPMSNNTEYDSEGSELSAISKISSTSILSTQSERPSRTNTKRLNAFGYMSHIDEKPSKCQSLETDLNTSQQVVSQLTNQTTKTPVSTTSVADKKSKKPSTDTIVSDRNCTKTDGTLSDSALSTPGNYSDSKKRRASMAKALVILGLSRKSKRFGFARSEEIGVTPELRNQSIDKTDSTTSDQTNNENSALKPSLWSGALKLPHELPYNEFVDTLGPGQKVGRQVLGLPCLGELQMSIMIEKNQLAIEIIRARNLKVKSGYRLLPAAYVKLYIFDGRCCIEKLKTSVARRTLEPMYQEVLRFQQSHRDKILQVTIWGDYGKLDRKVFMGVAQIMLNELNLTSMVIGWYKLYSVSSLMSDYASLLSKSSTMSTKNLESTGSGFSFDSDNMAQILK